MAVPVPNALAASTRLVAAIKDLNRIEWPVDQPSGVAVFQNAFVISGFSDVEDDSTDIPIIPDSSKLQLSLEFY
ncbi:hypothetical protein ABVN23_14780 [Pseudomonas fluorescens]|uniref:hypothetical protein n=1 Tax=Pseudomonas fluorescens TaxID=294 RepID=UPI003F95B44C